MRRVLIPIDGSECALRGVSLLVAERARQFEPADLEVHLVNVQVPFSRDISRFASHEQIATYHCEESEKLAQDARRLLDAAGVNYSFHPAVGQVAETIASLADSLQCERIVMGTHGRSVLGELLLGSTTLKVIHLASVPVLLAK